VLTIIFKKNYIAIQGIVPQTPYRGFAPGTHWGTNPQAPLSVRYFRLWHLATLLVRRSMRGRMFIAQNYTNLTRHCTFSCAVID